MELFYQYWLSPESARNGKNAAGNRTVVFHHGVGEHSGRYQNLLDAFEGDDIDFFALDCRGHGHSPGTRGDAPGVGAFVQDLEDFIQFIRAEHGVAAPILLGHSMGGLIAIAFALTHSNQWHLRGLVTSGAALTPHLDFIQNLKINSAQLLVHLAPRLVMPTGLPPTGLSHDQRVIDQYRNDPLCHDKLSVRLGVSLVETGTDCLRRSDLLKIPVLITHGNDDPIVNPQGSIDFYHRVLSADRDLIVYPGLYHEIYNETLDQRERVFKDLRNWVLTHTPERVTETEADMATVSSDPQASANIAVSTPD